MLRKVHEFHRDTMVVDVRLYVGRRFVEVEEGPRVPSRYDGGSLGLTVEVHGSIQMRCLLFSVIRLIYVKVLIITYYSYLLII